MSIPAGEEVTIAYSGLLSSTPERRARLAGHWFFLCRCRRCRGPSDELGTFAGSPLCPRCGRGSLLPEEVGEGGDDGEYVWQCNKG